MERTWWISNSDLELSLKLVKVSLLFFCVFVAEAENPTHVYPHARIVGGTPVKIKDYAAFVAIFRVNNEIFCGGTYIQPLWVITAAHCVVNMDQQPLMPIDVNLVKLRMGVSSYADTGQNRDVVQITPHEKFYYNKTWTIHDVALLKIDRQFDLNQDVQLGQVIPRYPYPKEAVAVGYGTKTSATEANWELVKVDLTITQESGLYLGTGSVKREGPCHSDSGGPLYLREYHTTVVGVVTYGTCSGGLTWFTHLYKYKDWVSSKIPRSGATAQVLVRNLVCYLTLLSLFVYHR